MEASRTGQTSRYRPQHSFLSHISPKQGGIWGTQVGAAAALFDRESYEPYGPPKRMKRCECPIQAFYWLEVGYILRFAAGVFSTASRVPKQNGRPGNTLSARSTKNKCYYCGLLTPCGGAGAASAGALCCTPIALPETTRFTRRFCALPVDVELSAIGLLLP